jgi:hypothetical protein
VAEEPLGVVTITLGPERLNVADLAAATEALNGIVSGGVWAAINSDSEESRELRRAWRILSDESAGRRAAARFHPGFYEELSVHWRKRWPDRERLGLSAYEPLDAGMQAGIFAWMRRSLYREDPKLCASLFDFAQIRRIEHHSPLLMEVAIFLGAVTLPAFLVFGCLKAAALARKSNAEAEIREEEARIRREEGKQQEMKTRVQKLIEEEIYRQASEGKLKVPKEAVVEFVRVVSPSVADLGDTSLIKDLTIFGK